MSTLIFFLSLCLAGHQLRRRHFYWPTGAEGSDRGTARGPQYLFQCRYCHKTMASRHSMEIHERVHTGETPFRCRICGRGFIREFSRKAHEVVHTPQTPYSCNICGKGLYRKDSIKRHKRSVHKIYSD